MHDKLNVSKETIFDTQNKPLSEDDCTFFSYGLNDKPRSNNINHSICVKDFYTAIIEKNRTFFQSKFNSEGKLHNINLDHV